MITYEPLFKTMQARGITSYALIYHYNISSSTIRRLKANKPMNTTTINLLCNILKCNIWDILCYTSTPEELEEVENIKKETIARYSHPRKKKTE